MRGIEQETTKFTTWKGSAGVTLNGNDASDAEYSFQSWTLTIEQAWMYPIN